MTTSGPGRANSDNRLQPAQLQRFQAVMALLKDHMNSTGQTNVEIMPVRYIEGPYSHVLRVLIKEPADVRPAYIKIYKINGHQQGTIRSAQEKVAAEFDSLRSAAALFAGSAECAVVQPIACFPQEFTLITAEAEGTDVATMLGQALPRFVASHRRRLTDAFTRIGLWVRTFQGPESPDGERLSLSAMHSYIDARLQMLVNGGSFAELERGQVLRRFDALAAQICPADLASVRAHADFCPSNVYVSGSKVTVLDPVPGRSDSHYHDLAHMFLHLENLKMRPWVGVRAVQGFQAAMLRGFDPGLTSDAPLFQLAFMRNVVSRLVHDQGENSSGLRRWLIAVMRRHVVRMLKTFPDQTITAAALAQPSDDLVEHHKWL